MDVFNLFQDRPIEPQPSPSTTSRSTRWLETASPTFSQTTPSKCWPKTIKFISCGKYISVDQEPVSVCQEIFSVDQESFSVDQESFRFIKNRTVFIKNHTVFIKNQFRFIIYHFRLIIYHFWFIKDRFRSIINHFWFIKNQFRFINKMTIIQFALINN